MSVTYKLGVEFAVFAPGGFLILQSLKAASKTLGVDLTITSGTDGVHSGPMDPHHRGEAYDVRSHDFDDATKQKVLAAIMAPLSWQHFFGFVEAPGTPNEHLHVQTKKGMGFTVDDFLAFVESAPVAQAPA